MEKMKMGILGSGGIAHTMANTVKQMADVELYAVGARTLEKAQSFAEEFGMPKAYGSYEELAVQKSDHRLRFRARRYGTVYVSGFHQGRDL